VKVLIVGDWHSDLHEEEVRRSLMRLGHEVYAFKWCGYFKSHGKYKNNPLSLIKRFQNKYVIGPIINNINNDFYNAALDFQPDIIFIYRGTHILPSTLHNVKLALPASQLIGYNNDDPFSPIQPSYYWRHFMSGIPLYDLMLAYRIHNLEDLKRVGANKVKLLRSWYVPDRNFPIELSGDDKKRYKADVVFIGHNEADNRLSYLEAIINGGFELKIFGPPETWLIAIEKSKILKPLLPIRKVWGPEYNKAICGANIALCFLSKLNRDTYTRRCFEIPASGTLLLSEYSEDLAGLFKEGVEADYFRGVDEMLEKIKFYLENPELREKISYAGYLKVKAAGHDIDSRMKNMLNELN